MKRRLYLLIVLFMFLCWIYPMKVGAQEPLDGPNRQFTDPLLDRLAGDWKLTRKIRGQTVENLAKAEWVLNHQFLLVHMTGPPTPSTYEAMVFIGYDHTSDRYVAHWIDVGGGRYSETLGYGKRVRNEIKFVFEYPDGPFTNTFKWDPEGKVWSCLMEQKDKTGRWKTFAEDTLRRP